MISKMLLAVVLGGVVANRPDGPAPKADKPSIDKREKEQEISDLSGYYTCKGEEANGKKYTGIAVISKKNDVYLVQWVVGAGAPFTGIGIRQGNTLSASWALSTDKGVVRGVNMYRIEPGPRLSGQWATLPGNGVVQTETLIFLKGLEPEDE